MLSVHIYTSLDKLSHVCIVAMESISNTLPINCMQFYVYDRIFGENYCVKITSLLNLEKTFQQTKLGHTEIDRSRYLLVFGEPTATAASFSCKSKNTSDNQSVTNFSRKFPYTFQ